MKQEHEHGHQPGEHCEHHGQNPPMCVCDHNPGGECHCPPNECKCDQEHHKHGETQHGHDCCNTDAKHDGPTQSTKTVINSCRHHPYEMCSCPDEHRAESVEALAAELAAGGAAGGHEIHAGHDMHGMDHSAHDMHAGHDMHDHSGHAGHDHSHHDPKIFARQFWFALALTIPTMLYSPMFGHLTNLQLPAFPGSQFFAPVLGIILFFTGGMVFLKTGWQEIRAKQPGMMALIALALVVSFGYSLAVTVASVFGLPFTGMDFWWELAALVAIMLLGHWIEMSSVMRAQNAVGELAKLIPDTTEIIRSGVPTRVPVSELKVGDTILVRAGASIPVDGVVTKGESNVNESMLTGESALVAKAKGDTVIAGTINGEVHSVGRGALELGLDGELETSSNLGAMTIKVTAVGGDTMLSGIMKLVAEAQQGKSRTQRLADRAAGWLFYMALGSAIITLASWIAVGGYSPDFVIERVVTVLVIACPHALGLAIPLVTAITTAKAANSGVLIRDRVAFESLRKVNVVLFDKTGTLTTGERGVAGVHLAQSSDISTDALLALAAGIEAESEHSLARAIVGEAANRKLAPEPVRDQMVMPGLGVSGRLEQHRVFAGGPALLTQNKITVGVQDLVAADAANSSGLTVVYIVRDDQLLGFISVGDVIRESAREAVAALQAAGKRVAMLTGDASGVAQAIASELGIDEVFAEVLPHQKAQVVTDLQAKGSTVAMVGDGVNDAPALAQANVGLAIGSGTDVAIESAAVILVSSDPAAVVRAMRLSKRSYSKMVQNLWWAAGYNILAIPLAAGALIPFGFTLSPALGAVLMSLSTIVVAANAQLLRRK